MMHVDSGTLLREARLKSGLSQRALAERAGTAQSVVARIELGRSSPSFTTIAALLRAMGFGLIVSMQPIPVIGDHMLDDVARVLRLTPEQRLLELGNVARFFAAAERV